MGGKCYGSPDRNCIYIYKNTASKNMLNEIDVFNRTETNGILGSNGG